jgi:corrinoid protein of di/trimethylamine methyltransferase
MDISKQTPEQKELLESLKLAIIAMDDDKAKQIAQTIVDKGFDPEPAIKYSIAEGAVEIGIKFDKGEIFLPHLVMAGDLMDDVAKILEKNIDAEKIEKKKIILIATVQGDMHSVGKNLVSTMLKSGGFDVYDMGVDVPSATIIEKAKDISADMIALSSLLTTTMPYQKEVIEDLQAMGIRNRFKVMIGGGPVTNEYAMEIGADAYGKDAVEALEVAKRVLA